MSIDTRYHMIDNYIYLFHTNELIVVPTFANSVTDSISVSFASETPLTRSAPIYSYQNSGPRNLHFDFDLHRENMWEINYKVSTVKPDAGDDYVDYMIKAVQAAALPEYSLAEKMVNPPMIAVRMGNDIFIKGVVTGDVGVTYTAPIISGRNPDGSINDSISRYASVRIAFSVNEVDPYQASDVMKYGSYRGIPTTLERITSNDLMGPVTKNIYNTTQKPVDSRLYRAGGGSVFLTKE